MYLQLHTTFKIFSKFPGYLHWLRTPHRSTHEQTAMRRSAWTTRRRCWRWACCPPLMQSCSRARPLSTRRHCANCSALCPPVYLRSAWPAALPPTCVGRRPRFTQRWPSSFLCPTSVVSSRAGQPVSVMTFRRSFLYGFVNDGIAYCIDDF